MQHWKTFFALCFPSNLFLRSNL